MFSGYGKLTISNVMVIINYFKSSIQHEPGSFFKKISKNDLRLRGVTKGAPTKARSKLNP
jgi:hypothetical protein